MHFGLSFLIPLVLYASAIVVFLASVFWRPEIGIYYLVPLFPLQTVRYKILDFPLGSKLIDIILLGVVIGVLVRREFKLVPKTQLNKLLALFALFLYVSLWRGALFLDTELPFWIDNPRFSTWKNYMVLPLVFILVVSVIKEIRQIKILVLLMCVSALLANKSFYDVVGGRDLSHFSYEMRDAGAFGFAGANGAGAFDAWFALFLLSLCAYQTKALLKVPTLGLAGFSIYCLMLTFSRGAYIGFLVGLVLLAIIKERKLLLLLIPFLFTWQAFVPVSVQERIFSTYNSSDQQLEASAAERIALWEDARQLIPRNPLFGTGYNTYEYMHSAGIKVGEIELTDTHNYYLKVLVETGISGLLLLLVLFAKMFFVGYRLYRTAEDPFLKSIGLGLVLAVVAVAVVNIFGDRWQYVQIVGFFWVVVACAVRGLMLTQQTARENAATVGVGAGPLMEDVSTPLGQQAFRARI